MNLLQNREFIRFVVKFILVFVVCYYGTLAIIGLSAPGGHYVGFVNEYLNYIRWLRSSLLHGTKALLDVFGVKTYFASQYNLRMVNGRGIILVYECVGYGVMSFWVAFVIASAAGFKRKLLWLCGGLFFLWFLNICRLALLLMATNKNWPIPLGWDHHTWFNIVAYIAIFILMYFFQRNTPLKKEESNV